MKDKVPENVFATLNVLEVFMEKEKWKNQTQTKISKERLSSYVTENFI